MNSVGQYYFVMVNYSFKGQIVFFQIIIVLLGLIFIVADFTEPVNGRDFIMIWSDS